MWYPHRECGVRSANEAEWSESVNFSRFHIGGTNKTGGVQGERAQINPRVGGYERMPKKHFKSVVGNMTWSLRM